MLQGFKVYRQLDSMDCGPACLKMILNYHGKQISSSKIKEDTQLGKLGTSLLDLSEAAERYGYHTMSAKVSFKELRDLPLPCILHWNQNHFVVLTSIKKTTIKIADPASGLISYSQNEFLHNWVGALENDIQKGIVLIMIPTPGFYEEEYDKEQSRSSIFVREFFRKYKNQFVQLVLGLSLSSLIQLLFPFLTQSIVDTGIGTHNLSFVQLILIAQLSLFFGRIMIEFIRGRTLLYLSTHINLTILSEFWAKLMRLPLSFYDSRNSGDILQRINDHHRIENFITGSFLQTIFSLINLSIFSLILFFYNKSTFLIFSIGSAMYFGWIYTFLKYRKSLDIKRFSVASRESSLTVQLIQGMHEIKLNGAELLKRWEWESIQASLFKLNFKSLSLSQYQQAGAFFINEGKNALITYLIVKSVLDGELTFGAMVAVQYVIGQLNNPIEQLVTFAQQAQDAKLSITRLNDIHELEEEEPINRQFLQKLPDERSIVFENFFFTYSRSGKIPVLKNINFVIPQGKITAIVGSSGSGKTTLLKIILKFYESYEGTIRIGGVDFKSLSSKAWRAHCGSVTQDSFIFSDTIASNIALGDETPSFEKLTRACRIACILEFIESLPLGLDTKIGSEGIGISAGQRQRILIARAVYKNPSFILFDEATNALDANTEYKIIKNLEEFFKGRTVLVVAHRLSTVRNADNIIVIENGSIVEQGTHLSLSETKGRYFELLKNQLELGN